MSTTDETTRDRPKIQHRTHLQIVALVPPATPLRAVHAYTYDDHILVEAYEVVTLALVDAYEARAMPGEYLDFSPDDPRWQKTESPEVRGIFRTDPEAGCFSGPALAMVEEDQCANAEFVGYVREDQPLEDVLVSSAIVRRGLPVVILGGELGEHARRCQAGKINRATRRAGVQVPWAAPRNCDRRHPPTMSNVKALRER
jgi:hypothetical protein